MILIWHRMNHSVKRRRQALHQTHHHYYVNINVEAANLSDWRIESNRKNRFGSENESKLFLPELECSTVCAPYRLSIDICRRQKAAAVSVVRCDPRDEDRLGRDASSESGSSDTAWRCRSSCSASFSWEWWSAEFDGLGPVSLNSVNFNHQSTNALSNIAIGWHVAWPTMFMRHNQPFCLKLRRS